MSHLLAQHVRAEPALLKPSAEAGKRSEQELRYERLIRQAYLLAVNTVAAVELPPPAAEREEKKKGSAEGEILLLTGQESGDLVVWSISGRYLVNFHGC